MCNVLIWILVSKAPPQPPTSPSPYTCNSLTVICYPRRSDSRYLVSEGRLIKRFLPDTSGVAKERRGINQGWNTVLHPFKPEMRRMVCASHSVEQMKQREIKTEIKLKWMRWWWWWRGLGSHKDKSNRSQLWFGQKEITNMKMVVVICCSVIEICSPQSFKGLMAWNGRFMRFFNMNMSSPSLPMVPK